MEKSRLVELLRTFSLDEWRDFRNLLRSPFFVRTQKPLRLADGIRKALDSPKKLTKEALFPLLFPKKKAFDDGAMRLAMTELLRLAEELLIWREAQPDDAVQAKIRLAAAYRKRGLGRHFERNIEAARELQAEKTHRHAESLALEHDLEFEFYQMASSQKRTADLNLPQTADALDAHFLARRLRLACFAQSHRRVWAGADGEPGLLPAALDFLAKRPDFLKMPAVAVYFFGFRALGADGTGEDFERFRQSIFENSAAFPLDEQRNLFLLAINFCVRKVNLGESGWAEQALEFYQIGLERQLFLENGTLSRFAFANIVAFAIKCRQLEWAEKFIDEQQVFLEKKEREAATALARARLFFEQKRFEKALAELQAADFRDLLNNLIAKILIAKIFFELGATEALLPHLETMRFFCKRHPKLGYHRDNSLIFNELLRKMATVGDAGRAVLKKKIEAAPAGAEREWLLEKWASPRSEAHF